MKVENEKLQNMSAQMRDFESMVNSLNFQSDAKANNPKTRFQNRTRKRGTTSTVTGMDPKQQAPTLSIDYQNLFGPRNETRSVIQDQFLKNRQSFHKIVGGTKTRNL